MKFPSASFLRRREGEDHAQVKPQETGNIQHKTRWAPGVLMPPRALPGRFCLVRLQGNDGNLARSDP